MKISFDILGLFRKKDKTEQPSVKQNQQGFETPERVQKLRALEEEMFEKMRNHEVEENVKTSLKAVGCNLVDFEKKSNNIAGWIVSSKSMNKMAMRNAFVEGSKVGTQDLSLKNSFKLPSAANYYYENFYSEQKQFEIYNNAQEIQKQYNKMMEEVK